jgi:hypothetical protein
MAAVHHEQCETEEILLKHIKKDFSGIHLFTRLEMFHVTYADEKKNRQFWM